MHLLDLGSLSAVVCDPIAPAAVPTDVVLLHGFGAPGTDLVGLARSLNAPPGTRFIFPQAPHLLDPQQPQGGRAWWHIDMLSLSVMRMTGQDDELAQMDPPGLDEARSALDQALLQLQEEHGLAFERTVLGGFSQGAMLSCDWALRSNQPLAGLVQLSGTVICEPEWTARLPRRAMLNVFQSHSPDDQVLPFSLAERLATHMKRAALAHQFVSFRGGHGIGPEVSAALSDFLTRRLKAVI